MCQLYLDSFVSSILDNGQSIEVIRDTIVAKATGKLPELFNGQVGKWKKPNVQEQ